ncbi:MULTISPECIES: acyl carrier protein [unclassified Halomonas]|uniref:acyl carrier protein n=1 Tax=unclassified Halomonas TaxID=2609666 RepID=UPI001CF14647|nr:MULTISPECIES: acyl carrier protein [unclassified Halomonas]MCA8866735.1 acyl carrier protein [Halomonas sp. SBBP1]UZH09234.1 acyl carrier protein [Halomonas sp. BDJS001]
MKNTIQRIFLEVFQREARGKTPPAINDDLILLESGLDSLGFAILVVELEDQLGYDPFSIADEAFYPQTFGEFVEFYEKHKP